MTELQQIDYEAVGLKCGIEIHQQLEGKKLFGRTPTIIRDDAPDFTIIRSLRAVVGETGVVDAAASAETNKGLLYQYQGYNDTIDLRELDEEPPCAMNPDSLITTVQIAKSLNATLVNEVQVMRKTVVDGSNTSGFQRTALVARNGFLTTSSGKRIDIPTIIVEEDACKKVSEKDGVVVYNLSRLGIPLIEISTDPQLANAREVSQVAEKLGLMLRSLPGVKRGLGTIRQDLNVSVRGGNRVEIKGAQDLRMLEQFVDFEIIRQLNILQLHKDLSARGFSTNSVSVAASTEVDVSSCFANTSCELISKALKQGKVVLGMRVPKFAGIIGRELQPNKRVGSEISDFAKVGAGVGGLIHSDEKMDKYNIIPSEIVAVSKLLSINEALQDAFILVVDTKGRCHNAFTAIRERIVQLSTTMPREVRRANPDATTTYMRPMPGQARMYPETDVPPVVIDFEVAVPEMIEQKIERYVKQYGLPADRAKMIAKSENAAQFESYFESYPNIKASAIVETVIGSTLSDVEKKAGAKPMLNSDDFNVLFSSWNNGQIAAGSIVSALCATVVEKISISDAIKQFSPLSDEELRKIIVSVVAANPGQQLGALTGKVMAQVKGRADGKKVGELLKSAM